jgi:hypothetical protein
MQIARVVLIGAVLGLLLAWTARASAQVCYGGVCYPGRATAQAQSYQSPRIIDLPERDIVVRRHEPRIIVESDAYSGGCYGGSYSGSYGTYGAVYEREPILIAEPGYGSVRGIGAASDLGYFGRPGRRYTGVSYNGNTAVAPGRADIEFGPYGVRVRPRFGLRRFLNLREY